MAANVQYKPEDFTTNVVNLSTYLVDVAHSLSDNLKAASEVVVSNTFNRLHETLDLSDENLINLSAAVVFINTAIYAGSLGEAEAAALKQYPKSIAYAHDYVTHSFDVNDLENLVSVDFSVLLKVV